MNQYAVIIDFSHLFHLCWSAAIQAGPQYDVSTTLNVQAEGKLRTIKRELEKLRVVGYDLVFAEDRPATRKLGLHPGYRAGRVDRSEDKTRLKEYLITSMHLRRRFCHSDGNEADDTIATLVHLARRSPGMFSVVVSSDRDLWQLMDPTTIIYNPVTYGGRRGVVTPEVVWDAFKVQPRHIPLVKAIWGDAGDTVPNAVPRTQKQLLPVIRETKFGTMEEFECGLSVVWNSLTRKCRELWTDGLEQVKINDQLVRLDSHCPLEWD